MARNHTVQVNENSPLTGTFEIFRWDAKQVPNFEAKLKLNELSDRNKRQLALVHNKGKNTKITAGLTALLSNLSTISGYSQTAFNSFRVGSGTTTPTAADTDVQTLISPTQTTTRFTVSGTTATWELFLTSADNIGTIANVAVCSGSPGTLLTHFLTNSTTGVPHTSDDTVTITYSLGVS